MGYLYGETSGEFGLLDKDGHWTFRTNGVNATELRCNNVIGFVMNASGQVTLSSTLTTNGVIQANSSINLKNQITLPASGLSNISGRPAYAIYQEGGAWTYPYPDLVIAMHTGIKLGANASYNGIRFYTIMICQRKLWLLMIVHHQLELVTYMLIKFYKLGQV